VAVATANEVMGHVRAQLSSLAGSAQGSYTVQLADEFTYLDPVDGSISPNQGLRVLFTDGSRIIYRLSGTAGSGATLRVYLERYEGDAARLLLPTAQALGELASIALRLSDLANITGMAEPTVIT
jgi:phosphoglucomutase